MPAMRFEDIVMLRKRPTSRRRDVSRSRIAKGWRRENRTI